MQHLRGWGWGRCVWMSLKVSNGPTLTTRPLGGMPGATLLEREAKKVSQVWVWWSLKFGLPLRTLGTPPCLPHVSWPWSCPPRDPHPRLSPIHTHLFVRPPMFPAVMEAIIKKMMEKMTNKMVFLTCVCFGVLLVQFVIQFFPFHV